MEQQENRPMGDPTQAIGRMVARIDPHVEFSIREQGPKTSYVARDSRTGKFFRFGAAEYHIASLLDGNRTLGKLQERLIEDGLDWSVADVARFVAQLSKHHLAMVIDTNSESNSDVGMTDQTSRGSEAASEPENMPNEQALRPPSRRPLMLQRVLQMSSRLLTQRFPLLDGDALASKLLPAVGWIFSAPAIIACAALVCFGVAAVWGHWALFEAEIRRVFDQQLWLVVGLIWCALKFVHECGHALCAKRKGVTVGRMGVMFFLFAPIAYVDVTDAWRLRRRRDRIQIAMAGVYLELAIGAVAALVWRFGPGGFSGHLAAQVFLIAGPATLLVNANPLLRLDGYYVLSDFLEIPNLRQQGRERLIGFIERVFFQLPLPESHLSPPWRRDVAVAHAALSVVFQFVWMTGLIIAVSSWAKGLGVVLAAVAAVMWGLLPLVRWMHKIWMIEPREGWILNVYQRRLLALCVFVTLAMQFAAVQTSPFSRRIPVVVRYQDEQIARAPADAFVSSVFVKCGDRVEVGSLLMELHQSDLVLRHDQLTDQRELAESRAVQLRRQGQIALAIAMSEKAKGLSNQIHELNDQLHGMEIVATRPGRITTRTVERLLGAYVRQGDELIRVSDPQEKELLVVVAEENLDAYNHAADFGVFAEIRLRGGAAIRSPLARLQPSASRSLPHPALSATVGGPLPVQSLSRGETYQLVEPQLQSVLTLDPLTSLAVHSGQTGRLTVPDDRTLLSRIKDHYWAE